MNSSYTAPIDPNHDLKLTLLPTSFHFIGKDNREALRITSDGRIIPGEGLSDDEVTKKTVEAICVAFPDLIDKAVRDKTASLQAFLDTEKELREGAEKNYRDLCTFLRGDTPLPSSYNLHVFGDAQSIRAQIEEGCS